MTGNSPRPLRLPRLSAIEVRRSWSRGARLHRVLQEWASKQNVVLPGQVQDVLIQSAVLLGRAHRWATVRPHLRMLVVGTQHNSAERAVLQATTLSGRATVYLPHAPVADNPMYGDLPTHWAILRGQAEVAWYRGLGAAASMSVGGDPSIASGVPADLLSSGQFVYAASDPDTVRQDVQIIRSAGLRNVTFCPHPRDDATKWDDEDFPGLG